jgi:hypothetical protein
MRYVPGDDLRSLVRREGRLEPRRAARLVAQVAAALDAAHAAGLVHRDAKPANVLLGPGDHVYLTDFGLTKHAISVGDATGPGRWVGTLDFVAPEQIRGERIDARADVYALGCVLYFTLTAGIPFPREGDEAKLWAHLSEAPPAVTEAAPGVSDRFDAVVQRAMAKFADDRYPSAGDLARAALAAAYGEAVAEPERIVAVGAAAPVEMDTRTAGTVVRPEAAAVESVTAVLPRRRDRRRVAVAVAGLLAAAAAAVVLVITLSDDPPAPAGAPATPPRIVASWPTGPRPNAVALGGGRTWVGSFLDTRLVVVDQQTSRRVRDVSPHVGVGTVDFAVDRSSVWVISSRERRLRRVDLESGRRIGAPTSLSGTPIAVAADPGRAAVWIGITGDSPRREGRLVRVHARTGKVLKEVTLPRRVTQLVALPGAVWVLARNAPELLEVDPTTGAVRRTIELPAEHTSFLSYGERMLWATVRDDDQLIRIDPRSGDYGTLSLSENPAWVDVHDGHAWVALNGSNELARVSTASMQPVGEPLVMPVNPYAVAAGPSGVWVTSVADRRLVRIDPGES